MNGKKNKTSSAVCSNCRGQLKIDQEQEFVVCPYCDTQYSVSDLLNESDDVKIEKIKYQTSQNQLKYDMEQEKLRNEKSAVENFKKGKFKFLLIVFTVISALLCVVSFNDGRILAALTAIIMTALFIVSYLMGLRIIKEKKNGFHVIPAILAFILIIPFFGLYNAGRPSYKTESAEFNWNDIEMCEFLPQPDNTYGSVTINSKTSLILSLSDVENKDFKNYRDKCIDFGYTIDSDESDMLYSAFNQDGYSLSLTYLDFNKEMQINLEAPEEMGEFEWPTNDFGNMLPPTKSNIGIISGNTSSYLSIHVGNTSPEDFKEYVKACESKGFTENYIKEDDYYSANNGKGYELHLDYKGFNKMEIFLEAAEQKDSEPISKPDESDSIPIVKDEETEETEEASDTNDSISPEFKSAMDSYEEFFDEYCEFMKKYNNSDGMDMDILNDFTDYMNKYTKAMNDLSAWESEEMNAAERKYYFEVQNRINQKLLEIA